MEIIYGGFKFCRRGSGVILHFIFILNCIFTPEQLRNFNLGSAKLLQECSWTFLDSSMDVTEMSRFRAYTRVVQSMRKALLNDVLSM